MGNKMNILIPMAGAGKRFQEVGYKDNKAVLPVMDRKTGRQMPMVVCAVSDLPEINCKDTKIIFVDRDFHKKDGIEKVISKYYPNSRFITLDYLTEGQACTCLKARELINNEDELLISACDNGIIFDDHRFETMRKEADVIVFTFTNNESAADNPNAYGWCVIDDEERMNCSKVSVKQAVSDNPLRDHAVIATFWYRRGMDFVSAAEEMIRADDRINNEFYVDNVINYNIKAGLSVKVFDVTKYLGWGTPKDYENYQDSIKYWQRFSDYLDMIDM